MNSCGASLVSAVEDDEVRLDPDDQRGEVGGEIALAELRVHRRLDAATRGARAELMQLAERLGHDQQFGAEARSRLEAVGLLLRHEPRRAAPRPARATAARSTAVSTSAVSVREFTTTSTR